ncbi:hypothetical protein ACKQF3_16295 [Vibrio cholerae]|uniref:hypothetical protein n=1 Tax=Vibrio cholerae TaxID=666 RepID=UPI00053C3A0D|nr:hypothetical protein [Vibrio cholerae]ELN6874687.1 hypothetical protein [Vibrio cholerae]ELS8905887.1 hypothetical protein [Vibrio cholerae]ELU8573150.1 hypothetical protein [Vibrio cholerae]ELW1709394.1 hypothetical protein [Vibrio cholerae]MDV2326588.1 hypothetical protein [Vibrio cholerae]
MTTTLHERDIVLSFNWDPLLERALELVGKKYTYKFEDKKIKLCKLHGSVNWRLGEVQDFHKSTVNLGWQPMDYTKGMMDVEMYYSSNLISKSEWFKPSRNSEIDPFLVLPGYGKSFDVRANAVMWYKPEFAFSFTQDVCIIGLSLAPDDFFIRSYFLNTLPFLSNVSESKPRTIHIINPATDVYENYSFVTNTQSCVVHCEYFSELHIKAMRENRERA